MPRQFISDAQIQKDIRKLAEIAQRFKTAAVKSEDAGLYWNQGSAHQEAAQYICKALESLQDYWDSPEFDNLPTYNELTPKAS